MAVALAGQQLEDGLVLPIAPGGAPPGAPQAVPQSDVALDEFVAAGYDLPQAEVLAELWQEDDLSLVKAVAGQQLLDGAALPITPP